MALVQSTQASATSTPARLPTVAQTSAPTLTPTPEVPKELLVKAEELKGQEVRFWHPLAGEAGAQMERLVTQFNLTNSWGVRVVLFSQGGAGTLDLAQEENRPGVVLAASEDIAYWNQSAGLPVDLSGYLVSSEWGMAASLREGYLPQFWQQDREGDAQLGIPALRTALGMIYNKSFAQELKFTSPPATPQELMVQTCAAAKDNNRLLARQGTGGWMVDTSPLSALSWFAAFGAALPPAKESEAWQFNQTPSNAALAYLREMQEKGCLWFPKNPTPQVYFGGRNALAYTATLQDYVLQAGYQEKIGSKDEWAMMPFPTLDGKGFVYSYGYSYAVLRSTPEEQMAAWLFVRWMSQPDVWLRLADEWLSIPVNRQMRTELGSRAETEPWKTALALEPLVKAGPSLASWRVVRRPLEDAFWQLFNLSAADQIPQLLPELDKMSSDMLKSSE